MPSRIIRSLACLFVAGAFAAGAAPARAEAEWVAVLRIADNQMSALIQRENRELWTIDIGPGCPALVLYKRRWAAVQFDGFFAGVGSYLVLPDHEQSCRIWSGSRMQ